MGNLSTILPRGSRARGRHKGVEVVLVSLKNSLGAVDGTEEYGRNGGVGGVTETMKSKK